MPATLTYPGVYPQEIPSGVRTIVGVATSITAFIGKAQRGPVDRPVTINGFGDFERTFGGLWKESSLGFAVRDFFLNGGGQAIIVRVFAPALDVAGIGTNLSDAATAAAGAGGATPASVAQDVQTAGNNARNGLPASLDAAVKKTITDAIDKIVKLATDKAAEQPAPSAADVAKAVTDNAEAIAAAAATDADTSVAKVSVDSITIWASSPGNWAKSLEVTVDREANDKLRGDIANSLGVKEDEVFNIGAFLRDPTTKQVVQSELFRSVTLVDSPRALDSLLREQSDLIRWRRPNPPPQAGFKIPKAKADGTPYTADQTFGDDGGTLTAAAVLGDQAAKTGMWALEDADLFNLLCIPPYTAVAPGQDADIDYASIIPAAASYCARRRAMLIIDPPSSWTDKGRARDDYRNGTSFQLVGPDARNAAVFFPRIRQPNPLKQNREETFVPCGTVAGVFARTDTTRGVWKAPAGIDAGLVGTTSLAVPLSDPENGELNPLGVNCLRTFPIIGSVVWGARTTRGADVLADEYKYIPIRRLALFIEESLFRGLKWAVFEPNDEPLWGQIRLNVGAFMNNLFRQGAFQGQAKNEAYFVKCDAETTTQNDRNLGIVNVVVGFAPLKPAEFVVLKVTQMAGAIET